LVLTRQGRYQQVRDNLRVKEVRLHGHDLRFVICHNPQQANGRLKLNRAKIKAEERLDGKYLLGTCDPHISAEDAALATRTFLEAERGFRDLKSDLLPRPVFHRLEHRIRAHVLICWLAVLLVTLAGPPARSCRPPHPSPNTKPSTRHVPSSHQPGSPPSTPAEQDQATNTGRGHTTLPRRMSILAAQRPDSDDRLTTNCGTRVMIHSVSGRAESGAGRVHDAAT
jgi:hypothetical protein